MVLYNCRYTRELHRNKGSNFSRFYNLAPCFVPHFNIQGLLGTNNGNAQDDFMTPEGDIVTDINAFGESWRVIDESEQTEPEELALDIPVFIDRCLINSTMKAEAERRCNTLRSGIFKRKLKLKLHLNVFV